MFGNARPERHQNNITMARMVLDATNPLAKNIDIVPCDISIDCQKASSARSPNTSASTSGASG